MDLKKKIRTATSLNKGQIKEFLTVVLKKPKTYPKFLKYGIEGRTVSGNTVTGGGTGFDHIELCGKSVSGIISYGSGADGVCKLYRYISFPPLRLKPNLTFSTFTRVFKPKVEILADGAEVKDEKLVSCYINGKLETVSDFKGGLDIKRCFYPSQENTAFIEKVEITNLTENKAVIRVTCKDKEKKVASAKCQYGAIVSRTALVGENGDFRSENPNQKIEKTIMPKGKSVHYMIYYAALKTEKLNFNAAKELTAREKQLSSYNRLLNTPNPYINAMYYHSTVRGFDGFNQTEKGLLHSPGGGRYYAGIWANDQMEYALPLFGMLDNPSCVSAAKNCIELYSSYMDFGDKPFAQKRAVPSSIVGGGLHPIGIAGDRGDSAMTGYGIARFLLSYGDWEYAREKLPLVEWCADFCLSRKTSDGVIASDSDELENRFPSGKCNLSTNILTYELLSCATLLENETGNKEKAENYDNEKTLLLSAIKKYFEADVEGYKTYRYYEGNTILRSWIVLPLIAGINDRAEGTINAVFEKLYDCGRLKTASNKEVYWDRSLLYALRACFNSGYSDKAAEMLADYSGKRLTGAHVPYAYEAFPEGNGSHLAAESLLYIRIITEGLFGITPAGIGRITVKPSVPESWEEVSVKGLICAGVQYGIEISGGETKIRVGNKSFSGTGVFDFKTLSFI